MNEIQLIRAQLQTERTHASAVASTCANTLAHAAPAALASGSPLEEFRQACVDYLVCILAWFEERDRRLSGLINSWPPEHPTRDALDAALSRRGRSRDALEKLEAAFADAPATGEREGRRLWGEFAHYFNEVWSARRDAVDALLATHARAGDWRTFGGIDADAILEERNRFQRVAHTLPPGATLPGPSR
jgi:hypothetical protein